jgi:uncharacterized protein
VRLLLAALALAACGSPAAAQLPAQGGAQAVAADVLLTGRVVDEADLLSESAEQRIADRLEALEAATTDQMVVVTLTTLRGAAIDEVGYELGNRWGLGRADVDNGVLLLIAAEEASVRLEVGTGLEGLLTDERAAGIVNAMIPTFEANLPMDAIETAVAEVDSLLRSDPKRPQYRTGKKPA